MMTPSNYKPNNVKSIWATCEIGQTYFYEPFGTFYTVVDKGLYPEVLEQYGIYGPINSGWLNDDISHAVILEDTLSKGKIAFVISKTGGI